MIGAPALLADLSGGDSAIVVSIVVLRLIVPLFIPRIPLVIIVALVLDGIDGSILEQFTDVDTGEDGPYQSFDKALDIYYLAIAYLSTMRNWTSDSAFRISQFLFYYRLVGVVLFELLNSRVMLLVFPNTFEYFFIVYEVIRLRYEPSRFSARSWLYWAAGLWIFVKLPQEYWVHVAQRDVTDTVREHPWVGVTAVVVLLLAAAVLWRFVFPRLPSPDWAWRFRADPPPASTVDARRNRFLSWELFEKLGLLSLVCVIFAEILPKVDATAPQVAVGVAAIVCANTAISLWAARRGGLDLGSAVVRFVALIGVNFVLVYIADLILSGEGRFDLGYGLFFAFLITLIIWLYDAFRPAYGARFDGSPLRLTSTGDLLRRVRTASA